MKYLHWLQWIVNSTLGLVLYMVAIDSKHLCNLFHFLVGVALTFFPMANFVNTDLCIAMFFLYFPDHCVNIQMMFINNKLRCYSLIAVSYWFRNDIEYLNVVAG